MSEISHFKECACYRIGLYNPALAGEHQTDLTMCPVYGTEMCSYSNKKDADCSYSALALEAALGKRRACRARGECML